VFPVNCKLKNIKGRCVLVASSEILPGTELLWNYGSHYWQNRPYKLTKNLLKPLRKKILWRGNEEERTRIKSLLK
jgi:hypothetical protein